MNIDVISDTICPWCFVGKRKLETAMAMRTDLTFSVRWRPYQLDPTIPSGGVDRKEYLRAKFGDGDRPKAIGEALRQAGEEEGIAFAFDKIARTPNTLDSHRLIRWAGSAGLQDQMVEALFRRYFERGEDLGSKDVLLSAAGEVGMGTDLVADLLSGDADKDLVQKEFDLAQQMGIQGVPAFVIADKYLLVGAQDPRILARVFAKVMGESEVVAPTSI
jgi:predicted DsbA family dithiol-disulfide isomerase